jgi:hypothetical protein
MTALEPVRADNPIELKLARSAVGFLLVLGGPVIAVAALLAGTSGALSAAVGASVVIGMFVMAGALMSYAARISPAALMAAVLGGYVLRLVIYAVLIVLLRPMAWVSGPSLAISTAVLLVAVLVWEVRAVSRMPNTLWVDARAGLGAPTAVVEPRRTAVAGTAPDFPTTSNPPVERTRP